MRQPPPRETGVSAPATRNLHLSFHGRIIDSLGIQMYQSPVAAVAELIANACNAFIANARSPTIGFFEVSTGVSPASSRSHPVAGFAIRSCFAGHPGGSAKTRHELRLKLDHSIGAGQVAQWQAWAFVR